jgi:hypothetical protein
MLGVRGFASALLASAAIVGVVTAEAGQELLVERTVAVVGGAAITLSDVRTALALGLVDGDEREGAARLVERWLILHEVSRFAPPEPAAADVEARVAAIRARAGSPAAFDAILARGGFTVGRLAAWLRDDLRIAAYLDQRFATAGTASEADVAEYAGTHAAELDAAGVIAADRLRVARERLQAERRRELITDWLAELRRRTPVVEIPD